MTSWGLHRFLLAAAMLSLLPLNANAALISGTIVKVAQSGKITVETTSNKQQEFQVPSSARITIDGKPGGFGRLEVGQRVSLITSSSGSVTQIKARTGTPTTPSPKPVPSSPATGTPPASETISGSGWTQFGGPNRDNISPETGLITEWPAGGPALNWTATGLGEGYSSVSISDDGKLYTMGNRGNQEMTICLDLATGKELWATQTGNAYRESQGNGPRSTPTIDGDRLYVLGGNGDLACLSRNDGEMLWSGNILRQYGADNIVWGISESVLIDGNKAVFTPGGRNATMVAVDKMSGRELWKSNVPGNPKAAYSSIIAADIGGSRQYVNFVHTAVVGVDAATGKALWGIQSPANGTANCSSPLASGNFVFAASGYGTGGTLVEVSGTRGNVSAKEVYHINEMKNHHGGMVLIDGYIYGTDEQILRCIELKTGETKWQSRSVGKGAVV
ncbi:MAG: PQQ-like beta-propeller repeat protein, partial [Planctomycetaceae bacterium]|nr:PQQ-like beta-propeller repeat protein [Planctomycetaceae bacterium]